MFSSTSPGEPNWPNDHLPRSGVISRAVSDSETLIRTSGTKRRRGNDEPGGQTSSHQMQNSSAINTFSNMTSQNIRRDETYYFEDGSCVLLVQDTLFNVHRTMLSRDGSSFTTMFTLPQGESLTEGSSDANPIHLVGDTAAEFRHFLWALYALPYEIISVHSPNADLDKMMAIAHIAHKYSFKSLEIWSLDAIHEYIILKPSPILKNIPVPVSHTFTQSSAPIPITAPISTSPVAASSTPSAAPPIDSSSTEQLTRLARLAQLCRHEKLLGTIITLLRQLMSASIQYAYVAMSLADELDLPALRGPAYFEVMQRAAVVRRARVDATAAITSGNSDNDNNGNKSSSLAEGAVDEEGRLVVTRDQQLLLLSGYYRLSRTWEHLRLRPPVFEHASSCGSTWHQQGCTQSWIDFWKEKSRSDAVVCWGLADLPGRLRAISREFERWGIATYMHHDCRVAAKRCLAEKITSVEDDLADYFKDE